MDTKVHFLYDLPPEGHAVLERIVTLYEGLLKACHLGCRGQGDEEEQTGEEVEESHEGPENMEQQESNGQNVEEGASEQQESDDQNVEEGASEQQERDDQNVEEERQQK
ncbi:hypothetical protein WMY93_009927 [Mugilogobius chulae]|uniref:Uncharacterized protein n=1 Tax=Mugilogobius chulae TaxID=88201 RepID=A0AAW0PC76_9GOBI